MPDHWGFVSAAYGIAVLVLFGYWRHLIRREAELHKWKARQEGRRA